MGIIMVIINNVETQQKHMYSLYISSLCNIYISYIYKKNVNAWMSFMIRNIAQSIFGKKDSSLIKWGGGGIGPFPKGHKCESKSCLHVGYVLVNFLNANIINQVYGLI